MQLSCKCLNIFINSNSHSFGHIDSKIKETHSCDFFFNEEVAPLLWSSVTIQIPNLIEQKDVGDWEISRCKNCAMMCYATNKYVGLSSLIASKKLLIGQNEINILKQSELYSPIFKILIFNQDVSDHEVDFKKTLYPAAVTWLKEQKDLTEERIKLYIEKEYTFLDALKTKAYKEQEALSRKEMKTFPEYDYHKTEVMNDEQELQSGVVDTESLLTSENENSVSHEDPSLDSEGIFLLDGFDGNSPHGTISDSEVTEDEEEVTYRKIALPQLAKSLPIPVPNFLDERKNDRSNRSPEVPSDIAASIKALAKSVHGDSIFGELPRPRFSTLL